MEDVIRENKDFNPDPVIFGRHPWDKAFERAFRGSFRELMSMHLSFGPAIGCAARIFQALAYTKVKKLNLIINLI